MVIKLSEHSRSVGSSSMTETVTVSNEVDSFSGLCSSVDSSLKTAADTSIIQLRRVTEN